MDIKRWWKNLRGKLSGYSGCGCCGDRWNWKESHHIRYSDMYGASHGVFPVCEECWHTKTEREIMFAAADLANLWDKGGTQPTEIADMLFGVRNAIIARRDDLDIQRRD